VPVLVKLHYMLAQSHYRRMTAVIDIVATPSLFHIAVLTTAARAALKRAAPWWAF
jgi:hypothetical protein